MLLISFLAALAAVAAEGIAVEDIAVQIAAAGMFVVVAAEDKM